MTLSVSTWIIYINPPDSLTGYPYGGTKCTAFPTVMVKTCTFCFPCPVKVFDLCSKQRSGSASGIHKCSWFSWQKFQSLLTHANNYHCLVMSLIMFSHANYWTWHDVVIEPSDLGWIYCDLLVDRGWWKPIQWSFWVGLFLYCVVLSQYKSSVSPSYRSSCWDPDLFCA